MEKMYERVVLELGLNGWEEQRNVVCEDFIRAVWKKKGDVGEWVFVLEYEKGENDDKVLYLLQLTVGRRIGAKCYAPVKLLEDAGVLPTLEAHKRAIVRLIEKELIGGEVCQLS